MAAIDKDTRLIMAILFVGSCCGLNVFFYGIYGGELPWTPLSHAVLFSLITIGGIIIMKAIFDMALNDWIELRLLDRRIRSYWERKQRDEEQKKKLRDAMSQFNLTPNYITQSNTNEVGSEFLASIEQ